LTRSSSPLNAMRWEDATWGAAKKAWRNGASAAAQLHFETDATLKLTWVRTNTVTPLVVCYLPYFVSSHIVTANGTIQVTCNIGRSTVY
jgi:hypothetical protein